MHQPLGTVKNELVNIVNIHNVEYSISKNSIGVINKSNHMFHVFHIYYSDNKNIIPTAPAKLALSKKIDILKPVSA